MIYSLLTSFFSLYVQLMLNVQPTAFQNRLDKLADEQLNNWASI